MGFHLPCIPLFLFEPHTFMLATLCIYRPRWLRQVCAYRTTFGFRRKLLLAQITLHLESIQPFRSRNGCGCSVCTACVPFQFIVSGIVCEVRMEDELLGGWRRLWVVFFVDTMVDDEACHCWTQLRSADTKGPSIGEKASKNCSSLRVCHRPPTLRRVTGEDQVAGFDLLVAGEAGFHE